jgi:hypothetical protein
MRFLQVGCFISITFVVADNFVSPLYGWYTNTVQNYILDIGTPSTRTYGHDYPSACTPNPQSSVLAYACPHMMMLSTDMILASYHDGLYNDFIYATAAAKTDSACGQCYQVKLLSPLTSNKFIFKQLIVQITNSGTDVRDGQFDIFMGAGGLGLFNACSRDCVQHYCNGGPCAGMGMFFGEFTEWTPNGCYGGGFDLVDYDNATAIWTRCQSLSGVNRSYRDNVLFQSCYLSNTLGYHQTFLDSDSLRVACPLGLTLLTGLKRNDERDLPLPSLGNDLSTKCLGSSGRECITSFNDCCKGSCSWGGKGNPDPVWNRVDSCNQFGFPLL